MYVCVSVRVCLHVCVCVCVGVCEAPTNSALGSVDKPEWNLAQMHDTSYGTCASVSIVHNQEHTRSRVVIRDYIVCKMINTLTPFLKMVEYLSRSKVLDMNNQVALLTSVEFNYPGHLLNDCV